MEVEDRAAARTLLVTPAHEVLLMQLCVPPERLVWVAPGGGLEEGELPSEAAAREVLEETGRRIEVGVPVWKRTHQFELEGRWIRQRETYFLANTPRFVPSTDGLESVERSWFRGYRWWDLAAIKTSEAVFSPRRFGELLEQLLRQGPPPSPIDVGI